MGAKQRRGTLTGLASVSARVVSCRRCPRLIQHCESVAAHRKREFRDWSYWGRPVPAFGDPLARLLIVGLAPAAHGANRTGRMFTGDSSGDWLYDALFRAGFSSQARSTSLDDGLTLNDCFITASARCAPPDNKPTRTELDRCQVYLETELQLLTRVRVTLVLGHIAHRRWMRASGLWDRVGPGARPVFAHGAVHRLEGGTALITSYHPSRQNTNTGRLTRDMWHHVFHTARKLIDELS